MMPCDHGLPTVLSSRPRNPESASAPDVPIAIANPEQKAARALQQQHRVDRTSFSSTKESDTGIAQSFTNSKTSSYLRWEVGA
jgi:hypothetical protein